MLIINPVISIWKIYFLCNLEYTSSPYSSHFFAATVILESSVGIGSACPGETVTYTCTVTGTSLTWTADPNGIPSGADIFYPPMSSTSTLSLTFTASLNGTVVHCTGTNTTESSTLTIAGTFFQYS